MEVVLSIIVAVLIFSVLILIHEFGHFYVARKVGIKVEEFGIGLPPRIWGKKIKGVLYSINSIPFGGFVRLYGEDSFDPKILKDKKSFASKPLRKRMAVVVAGVFMNFVLAFTLLSIGLTIGIEPLIVDADDILSAIESNTLELAHGARIKSVEEGSLADKAGLKINDQILSVNQEDLLDPVRQLSFFDDASDIDTVTFEILTGTEQRTVQLTISQDNLDIGADLYPLDLLPRVVIRDVLPGSESERAGLKSGDTIIAMNGKPVYFVDHEEFNQATYQSVINTANRIEYEIVRNNQLIIVPVEFDEKHRVVMLSLNPHSPAYKAGFKEGDVILQINDKEIFVPQDAIDLTKANPGKELLYTVDRKGKTEIIPVTPSEEGLIGVGLQTMNVYNHEQLSLYTTDFLTSYTAINDVSYPFPQSLGEALKESGRLSIITVKAFGGLVRSVVSQFAVPEGVAGPIGIAKLTHSEVMNKGLFALLRLTALLSLSLAVLNIIPFPALDGGRLLFLLIEAIRGKRIPAKWEATIHTFGFLLLIGLIFLVTYSDILNIFS